MNNRLYGHLIFELSKDGRKGYSLPQSNFGDYEIPQELCRKYDAALPECDELTVVRHYTISRIITSVSIQGFILLAPVR